MMMKRSISLVTALCLLSLCACAAPGGRAVSPASADGEMGSSVSFTDSLGSTITLEEAPQRVAALIGSYAETWVLAGGEDTLAAVTQDAYDERGLELGEDVTNVGSNQTPELEALFAAQPDLVLLTPDLDGQLGAGGAPGCGRHSRRLVQGGVLLRLPLHAGDLHPSDGAGRPVSGQRAGYPGRDRPGACPCPGGGAPHGPAAAGLLHRRPGQEQRQYHRRDAEGSGLYQHRGQRQRTAGGGSRWSPSWRRTRTISS